MRVLVPLSVGMSVSAWQRRGLAERELAYYSALAGHVGEVRLLSYGTLEEEQDIVEGWPGLTVGCLAPVPKVLPYSGLVQSVLGTLLLNRSNGCDVVRSNQFDGAWAAGLAARKWRVPFVLRCGYIYSKNYARRRPGANARLGLVRRLERNLARSAHDIIVTHRAAKEFLVETYGIDSKKIHIIGNAIDVKRFGCSGPVNSESGTGDIICVARHESAKNISELIMACARANASLTLVGSGSLTPELKRQAAEIGASVRFLGQVPNSQIPALLRSHKVFALVSLYEGNPKAVLEAMATEVPVLISDIPEHRELVTDGVHGLLCATSAESISAKLQILLSDPHLRSKLAETALDRVRCDYSYSENSKREAQLLLESKRRHAAFSAK